MWVTCSTTSLICHYNGDFEDIHYCIIMARRLSGLQKEVVHLYRQCIRTAHKKPIENRPHFITYIRREFDKYRSLSRKDFSTIEHLLRVGNRRLEMYAAPELKDIH